MHEKQTNRWKVSVLQENRHIHKNDKDKARSTRFILVQDNMTMAVARGNNWKRRKNSKLVQPKTFIEIGSTFMLENDWDDGAIYEVMVKEPEYPVSKYCDRCGLREMCELSNGSVPICTKTKRNDSIGVWFKKIW